VVHEKIFKGICYINPYKICPLRTWPFMTSRTSFEQAWISFQIPMHLNMWFIRRLLKICQIFPLFGHSNCPLKAQPLDFKSESPFPSDASYQIWLKSVWWFWRRSRLKEKVEGRRTLRHPISSAGRLPGELKKNNNERLNVHKHNFLLYQPKENPVIRKPVLY